jgi:TonB family protein
MPHPDFRAQSMRTACYYANLEFVVDTTGRVEEGSVRVINTNERTLGEALVEVVPSWRYEPARLDGARVRQITTQHYTVATGVVVVPR